jgi:hypothetical protein
LRREGVAMQYSAFSVRANDAGIKRLLSLIDDKIEPEDDVRAYHIPEHCPVWTLGMNFLPEGVMLSPLRAIALISSEVVPNQTLAAESHSVSVSGA